MQPPAHSNKQPSEFPLTNLVVRLIGMTTAEVERADPFRAAKTYAPLSPNVAAGYIQMEQRQRGLPVMPWEPVDWSPPEPAISHASMVEAANNWGPGTVCPHNITYPRSCPKCESAKHDMRPRRREPMRRPDHWAMLPDDAPDDPGSPG